MENDKMINNAEMIPNEDNFDMQTLMNLMGQNAVTVQQTAMTVQGLSQQMGIFTTKMTNVESNLSLAMSEIDQLKNNEEITTDQEFAIRETASKRISEVLGKDINDRQKYYRTFIGRLYYNARRNAGLGSKISRTKKCNFQRVIDYIESWNPHEGVLGLKHKTDAKAKARRKAQDEGYDC